MSPLATADDLEVRFGPISDAAQVEQLLADASSKVREEAGLHLSAVVGEVVTLDGDGHANLFLPNFPVADVSAVSVEGAALVVADDVYWWPNGRLARQSGAPWPCAPRSVQVTYSHGWDPTPDWIVGLVCSMVWESQRPSVLAGEQSISTGSQAITYVAARANLYVPPADVERLRSLRGPAIA